MLRPLSRLSALVPQRGLLVIVALILCIAVDTFAVDLGKLQADLARYQSDVTEIVKTAEKPSELHPLLLTYLWDNQASATATLDLISRNQAELEVMRQLELLNKKRIERRNLFLETFTSSSKEWPYQQKEHASWMTNLSPYLEAAYIRNLVIRKRLYEYKYFEEDDPKQANIVEGWLNGALPFTRYKDEEAWYRQNGVSKWEASTRVEPLLLLENNNHPGVLMSVGLLYNFFPVVSQADDDRFQTKVDDDFRSKYLKRSGIKLGAGAIFDDPNTDFLSGVGLQLRAWTVWGVYSTGDSRFSIAVGLSEWDWIKKFLPLFEK